MTGSPHTDWAPEEDTRAWHFAFPFHVSLHTSFPFSSQCSIIITCAVLLLPPDYFHRKAWNQMVRNIFNNETRTKQQTLLTCTGWNGCRPRVWISPPPPPPPPPPAMWGRVLYTWTTELLWLAGTWEESDC